MVSTGLVSTPFSLHPGTKVVSEKQSFLRSSSHPFVVTGNVTEMDVAFERHQGAIDFDNGYRAVRAMMLIDDDELSREVLCLIASEAGFEVQSFESGEAGLTFLIGNSGIDFVLCDLQMPGLAGNALAKRLRSVCALETKLLAMSGSKVPADQVTAFDAFLLKPFSAAELLSACDELIGGASSSAHSGQRIPGDVIQYGAVLNDTVYANFSASMPPGQVAALYQMCLDDAKRRLKKMELALEGRDEIEYRRAAHAIKGSCGMVGAIELAQLAGHMETSGLPAEHDLTTSRQFVDACARLERMLYIKVNGLEGASPAAVPQF